MFLPSQLTSMSGQSDAASLAAEVVEKSAEELENLLDYVQQIKHIDLTDYKRTFMERCVLSRMHQLNIEHYQDYLTYLKQHNHEASVLARETLICCTSFFRDRKVWDYLSDQVIPKILAHKAPDERIRVWSAGCATGEEVYSLAMLFAEALGREQFQRRVQLYGTDASLDTINRARRGQYSTEAMQPIPAHLRQKYFEPSSSGYCWRSDLRYPIWFHQRNLIHSPPWPNIDLLVCRHTLMYFTEQAKIRALVRFHFSLRDDGFLLLGRSVALHSPMQKRLFASLDYPMKLYQKIQGGQQAPDLLTIAFCGNKNEAAKIKSLPANCQN